MELKKYKIGDILELQRGYDLTSSQMEDGDVIVAGSNGIIGTHNVARGKMPCITVGRSGSVGKVHFYDQPVWAHNTSLFVKDFKGNDPEYLFYFLRNLHLDEIFGKSSSVVPSLDRKVVHAMKVPFQDDVNKQKDVADVLSLLDRKIALNRAINDNLEAMAKQLYDYWFVQFDFPNEEGKPYKSSGGKMVWNEKLKREIPEGWEVKTIGTFADVKRGSTITKAQTVEGDIKVVAAATDYSFLHNEANRSAYVITVSASGANAGFINFWREPIYASDCSTIQCEKIEETLYCYYWILHFQELLFTQQIGAAQPHVYPEHINKIPIVVPSPDILAKVKNLLVKSNQKQSEISREIESLTKQRDELLPLLMNGQVSPLNSD